MSCEDAIAKLVEDAQRAMMNPNDSFDYWFNQILNDVDQCTILGSPEYRNGLVLIIRSQLTNLRNHASVGVVPFAVLKGREVPQSTILPDERLPPSGT